MQWTKLQRDSLARLEKSPWSPVSSFVAVTARQPPLFSSSLLKIKDEKGLSLSLPLGYWATKNVSYSILTATDSSLTKYWISTQMKSKLSTRAACRTQCDLEFKTPFLNLALETHDFCADDYSKIHVLRKMDEGRRYRRLQNFCGWYLICLISFDPLESVQSQAMTLSFYYVAPMFYSDTISLLVSVNVINHYSEYVAPTLCWMQNKAAGMRTLCLSSDRARKNSTPGRWNVT